MRVGFIGLGLMGSGMTNNLQKAGHQLVLHDLRREAAEKLIANGAEWASSPRDVAASAEVVFTSLPGPPEFEAVAAGKNGLIEGMQRGQALFDLSTNSPTVVRRLNKLFADKGAHLLDSPVSGGPAGAPSTRWPSTSCRTTTIRRALPSSSPTRTSRSRRKSARRWACRCVSPTSPSRR
jgi:3-hydroxyisobutyrate dehydrogenase